MADFGRNQNIDKDQNEINHQFNDCGKHETPDKLLVCPPEEAVEKEKNPEFTSKKIRIRQGKKGKYNSGKDCFE